MNSPIPVPEIPEDELRFEFARSSGPGGQNVNKVNSKAILRWNPAVSLALTEPVRARLLVLARTRITLEGDLLIVSQRFRDQAKNIADCREKLRELLAKAVIPPVPRRPSKPSKAAKRRRVDDKRRLSSKKEGRRGVGGGSGDD